MMNVCKRIREQEATSVSERERLSLLHWWPTLGLTYTVVSPGVISVKETRSNSSYAPLCLVHQK